MKQTQFDDSMQAIKFRHNLKRKLILLFSSKKIILSIYVCSHELFR